VILQDLRTLVCRMNRELPRQGLVTMTSGNASGRDPETGYMVIKPSGVAFEDLTANRMCVLDADGEVVEGAFRPSVDAPTHLYIYRHMPHVNGVIHTHSNYATSFAALGQPIPAVLTAIAQLPDRGGADRAGGGGAYRELPGDPAAEPRGLRRGAHAGGIAEGGGDGGGRG